MKLLNQDKTKALPYGYYYVPVFLLTCLGIINAAYLSLTHYRNYTDLSWSSFCAISKAVNCDTVAQSPWSIFWGIPLGLWGVIGYTLFLLLLLSVRKINPGNVAVWSSLLMLGVIFSLTATVLGYISATHIGSYCILCLLSYVTSFLLLLYSWITWRRFGYDSFGQGLRAAFAAIKNNKFLKTGLLTLAGAAVLLKLFIPQYWLYETDVQYFSANTGYTIEGHPWIGAENPQIVIEEFTDYQCFQCYKTHYALRKITEQYPGKIRIIHRHYPLDHEFNPIASPEPFHIGSGRLALLSIAAAQQDKFWEINDFIYQELRNKKTSFEIDKVAETTGLDIDKLKKDFFSRESLKLLEQDIRAGLKHNITSTPTFVIDGEIYPGNIPVEVIEKITGG